MNHINAATPWTYWFVNPWSFAEQQSINLGSDPCVNEDSIFDGTGYVEYTTGGSDPEITVSHSMCSDGVSDLRYAFGSTEQFTSSAFYTDALDDSVQGNTFEVTELDTGLYVTQQSAYAEFDNDLERSYYWSWLFALEPLSSEVVDGLTYDAVIQSQGCYEHNEEVFTDVLMFGENTWAGYTSDDCTKMAHVAGFAYALITGNGVTEEACYGANDLTSYTLVRAADSNCMDWCDS